MTTRPVRANKMNGDWTLAFCRGSGGLLKLGDSLVRVGELVCSVEQAQYGGKVSRGSSYSRSHDYELCSYFLYLLHQLE